ncbi:MAG TPA: HEAT repeat domain-containing protein [Aggregatilineaceae bacterium]|nr:HEAT repeat domain-containing protein [Aggregatilineaceae bacterium]
MPRDLTGYEPRLSARIPHKGYRRFLPRQLGTLLSTLSPEAISLDAAAAMLRSEHLLVRYQAARLLAERGDREARLILQDILTAGEVPSRASVARHLHRLSWFSAEPLLRQALADPEEVVREAAVYALCEVRELDAFALLADALLEETDLVRAAAAFGLRNCQDSAAVPVLAAVLRADDPEVRVQGLEALSANNTPEAVSVVQSKLCDPEGEVVYNAVLSLLELCSEECLGELVVLIRQTQGSRLEPILRGLFHASNYLHLDWTGHPAWDALLDALASALDDPLAPVRMAAVWPVAWMRHERAATLLGEAFCRERDGAVKAHMLWVAACLMADGSSKLLEAGLQSDDSRLRDMAEHIREVQAVGAFADYDAADVAAKPLNRTELVGRR